MIFNQNNYSDLRDIFSDTVIKVFGSTPLFLDFLENEEYNNIKYDCFIESDGETYIINRETGEYINWYKCYHIGRDIHISILSDSVNVLEWFEEFLFKFKTGV
ncbi:MAG: hypothetical protein J6S85_24385 [Methanobrevibacter sp.]|nr:hypothetical protein [Methanobrevibacter sp.]